MQTLAITLSAVLGSLLGIGAGLMAWALKKLIDIDKRLAVMNASASLGAQLKIQELRELVDEHWTDFEQLREGHGTMVRAVEVLSERFNLHHHSPNRRVATGGTQ